jgi:hypothetical protein
MTEIPDADILRKKVVSVCRETFIFADVLKAFY